MSKKELITFSLVGTALALLAGSVVAQEPQPTQAPQSAATAPAAVRPDATTGPLQPNTAAGTQLGTAMSYQGQLQKSGGAYNGTCAFAFGLWDAATGEAFAHEPRQTWALAANASPLQHIQSR